MGHPLAGQGEGTACFTFFDTCTSERGISSRVHVRYITFALTDLQEDISMESIDILLIIIRLDQFYFKYLQYIR